jgi:hypothetical protein
MFSIIHGGYYLPVSSENLSLVSVVSKINYIFYIKTFPMRPENTLFDTEVQL